MGYFVALQHASLFATAELEGQPSLVRKNSRIFGSLAEENSKINNVCRKIRSEFR
jgi:hypothetical protein